MQMGTSDDLIGEIISNKIILSLMGSPGHKHGLAEKNHASRVGHFLPAMRPSIPAPWLLWFLSLSHVSHLLFAPQFFFPTTSSLSVPLCEMPLPAIL